MHRRSTVVLLACAALVCPASTADAKPRGWSAPSYVYAASEIQSPGYSYAPSVAGGRIYTCHSRASGLVRDDIFLTKPGVSSVSVLTSSASGWDSFHICDPSVVRVDVPYGGHTYSYALFYLGNDVDASRHNQVGVAVADSLDGPWTKLPAPVVPYTGSDEFQWGAGQPTATTIDAAAGTVLLAWTEGYNTGTLGRMARVDFSSGTPVLSGRQPVPTAGLTDLKGNPDFLNNFDLVYSPRRDRFFMVREGHPYPSGSSPDYISDHVDVNSISGAGLRSGTGTWRLEGRISAQPRVHNPGFARTVYGTLPDESALTVVYTAAQFDPGALWTYQLWQTTTALPTKTRGAR